VANLPPMSTMPVVNLPPVSITPAANFATSIAGVVDTGGKFATVSTTLEANLQPVHFELVIFLQIFKKIRNNPNSRLRDLGETDS
jgi:hypothetical protein